MDLPDLCYKLNVAVQGQSVESVSVAGRGRTLCKAMFAQRPHEQCATCASNVVHAAM